MLMKAHRGIAETAYSRMLQSECLPLTVGSLWAQTAGCCRSDWVPLLPAGRRPGLDQEHAAGGWFPPWKDSVRQTNMPRAFMSMATSSSAPTPRPPTASRKSWKAAKEGVPSPHSPRRSMYPRLRGSLAPDQESCQPSCMASVDSLQAQACASCTGTGTKGSWV